MRILSDFSPTYKNPIPFEIAEDKSGSNLPDYYAIYSQALIIKKNDIDAAHSFGPISDIQEAGGEITKIIPFKEAADIVSEGLTQSVKFDVISTDLIYHGSTNDDNISILKPTWTFVLYNNNDGNYYNVYVDAVSGDFNYYRYTT